MDHRNAFSTAWWTDLWDFGLIFSILISRWMLFSVMVLNVGLLYRVVLPQVRETLMWFRSITDLFEVCEFCWIMNVSSFSFGIDVMHNSRNHGSDSLYVSHVFSLAEQSVMVWFWHGFLLCNLSEQTGFCFLYFFHHAIVVIWLLIQVSIYNKKKQMILFCLSTLSIKLNCPKRTVCLKAHLYPLIMINSSKKKLWYILFSEKKKIYSLILDVKCSTTVILCTM